MADNSAGKSIYKQAGITIDVTEIKTLLAKFGDITPNLMRKSLRRGFAAIGKEVKAIQKSKIRAIEGKRKAGIGFNKKGKPIKNGLEKSITVKTNVDIKKGKAYMFVGPKRKATDLGTPSKYAHFVESGVKPHLIDVKKGHNQGRTFSHPGYKAQPFIAPSYEAIRLRAQRMMLDAMEQAIKETLK
jgi:HK97 gp10 family phage protein